MKKRALLATFLLIVGSCFISEVVFAESKAKSELEWSRVVSWKGNGMKTTEPFEVKKPWRIEWKNLGSVLQIYVYNLNGDLVALPVNTLEQGEDVSYVYETGEFYLTISAMGGWEVQIKDMRAIEQMTQSFFDLSTPENTAKSLMEAMIFGDKELADICFSARVPSWLVTMYTQNAIDSTVEALEEAGINSLEAKREGLSTFSYEKERIDDNSFYAWAVSATGERNDALCFRVELEEQEWKVLTPKSIEEQWFELEELL